MLRSLAIRAPKMLHFREATEQGSAKVTTITKHFLFFLLFIHIGHQSWAAGPDSTSGVVPIPQITPTSTTTKSGFILVSGIITPPLRCGWAKEGTSTRRWIDPSDPVDPHRCDKGVALTTPWGPFTKTCPSPLTAMVTVALVSYNTCGTQNDMHNMYGIRLDQPAIHAWDASGYKLYWSKEYNKYLFAGYNDCDDRAVTVAYTVWCFDLHEYY